MPKFTWAWVHMLVLTAVVAGPLNSGVAAETHRLSNRGKTLVEGERYSAASEKFPSAEFTQNSKRCSGRGNLGFFWANSWFEIELDVPEMLHYRMSLQASSPESARIEVLMVGEAGDMKPLTTIEVPRTESWSDYTKTHEAIVSLPAGTHTLRFRNLVNGANVDYIHFVAGSKEDVVISYPVALARHVTRDSGGINSERWSDEEQASLESQANASRPCELQVDAFGSNHVEQVIDRTATANRRDFLPAPANPFATRPFTADPFIGAPLTTDPDGTGVELQAKVVRHLVAADDSDQTHIEIDLFHAGTASFSEKWDVQLAVLDAETAEVLGQIESDTDIRALRPGESLTVAGSCHAKLDPRLRYQIGLRVVHPDAFTSETAISRDNIRSFYLELANDLPVIDAEWDVDNSLQGGWNLLEKVHRRAPAAIETLQGPFFPYQGSFRREW